MKTLVVNSHPFMSEKSYSKILLDKFCDKFKSKFSKDDLEILNLESEFIPRLDGVMLSLFSKDKGLDKNEQKISQKMKFLMHQFKNSKRIVIVMPMLNFNVASKFKDYMDNILIPGETFKYVTGGSAGLMNDGRKVLLLQSSGSIYTANDRYTPLEFTRLYIKEMFVNMMGFDDFYIIRAQGTSVGSVDKGKMVDNIANELDSVFDKFYM